MSNWIHDEICCDDAEEVIQGELVDMYGGDETWQDTWRCDTHKRAWTIEYGARTHGTQQIEEVDYDECI